MTLIEVLVALSILAIMTTAMVPLLVMGLKASTVSKMDTGAKNLAQQRFELMRNLPFRVAYDSAVTRSLDVLDTYYPFGPAQPASGTSGEGYVTGSAPRRAHEPQTGDFYRTRWDVSFNGGEYTQWVAVQFLEPKTKQPLAAVANYSASSYNDLPPSNLVGVTVTTEWSVGEMSKQYSAFTQIADATPLEQLTSAEARATALRVTTNLPSSTGAGDVVLEAGVVAVEGGLGSGAHAAASATGASASAFNTRVNGAIRSASAPPEVASQGSTDSSDHIAMVDGAKVAQIPATMVQHVGASTIGGNPVVASSSNPVTAVALGNHDLTLWTATDLQDMELSPTAPALTIPANGSTQQAVGSAWLSSTSGTAHGVDATATARTEAVSIVPTSFAPDGLLQVRLNSATMHCSADGGGASAEISYTAEVRYWRISTSDGVKTAGYSDWIAVGHTAAADPLQNVSLATDEQGVPVYEFGDGTQLMLGHYIKSLASQSSSDIAALSRVSPDGWAVQSSTPAMLSVATVPMRLSHGDSNVVASLGVLSCQAGDRR